VGEEHREGGKMKNPEIVIFNEKNFTPDIVEDVGTITVINTNNIEYPVNIYLLTRNEYFTHYTEHPRCILNPLDGKRYFLRGRHDFDGEEHNISLIMDGDFNKLGDWVEADWKGGLRHELIHCRQAEKVGVTIWKQLTDIYADDRANDPFEIEAYLRESDE
jgi:hypothetical protein